MTTINSKTKIAELIRINKASIDAIAGLAKPLEKLKNPILRKIMAGRVTIAEAAKMGGCSIDDFKSVLEPLGFSFESNQNTHEETQQEQRPEWLLKASESDIDRYDVRPIIENGADPLKAILHRFKEVAPGKILCIINNFVPTPLIHLLKKEKAEDTYLETISSTEYHTYFLKKAKTPEHSSQTPDSKVLMDDDTAFQKAVDGFTKAQIKEIDVRHLEMPLPMQTILGELQELEDEHALYVNHKRVPMYLLEELADKDFQVHILNNGEGNVKLLLYKLKN